jgi:hypothetical protein|uniref:Uncharacterized protein n=1 Tax=virus sp. ctyMK1 TaxID=2828002 RepID=A0A8S5REF5_9VIRU|nr:MAG TPA: hypothetical protein [virus sp. ctyMK1]
MGIKDKWVFYDYTADEMKIVVKRNIFSIVVSSIAIVISVVSFLI